MIQWRRETSWWDDLEVTKEVREEYSNVFTWLEEVAPEPHEHDYVLYTDGSGCDRGWGGYAAVVEKIDLVDEKRRVVGSWPILGGTYGSTVQRSEMTAFLEGIHSILRDRGEDLIETADDVDIYEIKSMGLLNRIINTDRPTVLWYTDRENLAKALLYDEDGNPLQGRRTEGDLWMRWSVFARHVCVTPLCTKRNVVDKQAACDGMAGAARKLLRDHIEIFDQIHHTETWTQRKPQSALF